MKTMKVRLQDENNVYHWRVQYMANVTNCTLGRKNRKMSGWLFTDHEGCERFSEGAWRELVAMFHLVASNYGLTTNLS